MYRAVNNLGAAYLCKNQFELAIEQFKKGDPGRFSHTLSESQIRVSPSLTVDSACSRGMLSLGMALVLQNITIEADRALQKAMLDFPQAGFWRGVVLVANGDLTSAKEQLATYLGTGDRNRSRVEVAEDLTRQIQLAPHGTQECTSQSGLEQRPDRPCELQESMPQLMLYDARLPHETLLDTKRGRSVKRGRWRFAITKREAVSSHCRT